MRTLVIGGAGSGKSEFAEGLCLTLGSALSYLATMRSDGAEAKRRIERHRSLREGKGFQTLECPQVACFTELPPLGTVLVECLGTLVANELFDSYENDGHGQKAEQVREDIEHCMRVLEQRCEHLVVVSNDVFSDGDSYSEATQTYLKVLAAINQSLAERYEGVIEVVCSIPLWHKGGQA